MRKSIILIALFLIPLITSSQSVNENKDGFTEVIEVELSKEEIYNKIKEWVAINYKSAQDVIQLDSKDKIIIKGNISYNYQGETKDAPLFDLRLDNTMIFSIRDNKYKIDFTPTKAIRKQGGTTVNDWLYLDLINTLGEDEFLQIKLERARNGLSNAGFKGKKLEKYMEMNSESLKNYGYDIYLKNKEVFNSKIESIYKSLKVFISLSSEDEW